mgnify:CR=1 FL=1
MKRPRMMAVLDPIKAGDRQTIRKVRSSNLDAPNNMENESLGSRKIPFGKELYIERDDFMIDPPKKI